jgi:hypothetical protein
MRSAIYSFAVPLNTWLHLAATYDGSYGRLYVNGVLRATSSLYSGTLDSSTNPLYVTHPTSPRILNGFLALPRIYNRALSLAEIQRNIRNPLNPVRDGLVLFLPMIEGAGTVVRDFSGYGNNGTLYNGVGWSELTKWELPAAAGL